MKKILIPLAAAALAGCCSLPQKCTDPVIGNWSGMMNYPNGFNATSLIFSRGDNGEPKAFVLWRWGSPEWCTDVKFYPDGGFSFTHPYGQKFEGKVVGDTMYGRHLAFDTRDGKLVGPWMPFKATRNPGICPCARTEDAVLGEPIDLLKDGLDGWKLMDGGSKDGWSFKDGVLSNKLGTNPDGSWAGGGKNLMTKRADFFDFNLEYDVRVPKDSNSGVYLRGRFECQVVDSYGKKNDWNDGRHNMAAYYGRVNPSVSVEKKPGEWQHVSVTLYKGHITTYLNGVKIIDNAELVGVTGGAIDSDLFANGPVYLQGDHSDADYKNMILRPAL